MKRLLLPFSLIFKAVTRLRNHLYDIGVRRSFHFDALMTIGVGNLSMGGTGKTPVTEYLIRLLKSDYSVASLSRGYGRKTKGLRLLSNEDNATTAGDEPVQLYRKFGGEINVVVSEDRILAIPTLLNEDSQPEVVILDDAYQHRRIRTDLNILLTKFEAPFFTDYLFPVGWLRESRKGARRADVLIITKCPTLLDHEQIIQITERARKYTGNIPIFFTRYRYSSPVSFGNQSSISKNIILITGIAQSSLLLNHCRQDFNVLQHFRFRDHHEYSLEDIRQIIQSISGRECSLLTTEKDMIRLSAFSSDQLISAQPWFYLPVEVEFLENGSEFDKLIIDKIKNKLNTNEHV